MGAHKHAVCSQEKADKEPGAEHLTHSMQCGPNRRKNREANKLFRDRMEGKKNAEKKTE